MGVISKPMDQTIHDYLKSVDVEGHWEYPPDMSYVCTFENLNRLKEKLEKLASFSLDIDENVQDASFITDIGILNENYYDRKSRSGAIVYHFAFRFSNFGNMFTLILSEDFGVEEKYNLKECTSYLISCGLKYIPASELHVDYDGLNKPHKKGFTWWVRYFDYL